MSRGEERAGPSAAERGRSGLWLGILAYRWVAFAWMVVLAFTSHDLRRPFLYPLLGWSAIGLAGLWTAWLTLARPWERRAVWWIDLALAVGLVLLSGFVVRRGDVAGGHPFFAASYPVSSVLAWGTAAGPMGGVLAGAGLSLALALSRPLNGLSFADLSASQWQALVNGFVYYLSAGLAVGLVSRVLVRSAGEIRRATESAIRERERAARLAERDSLARQIHDSILQALAMINKRGKELGAQTAVSGHDVRTLAEMADHQERALRSLIQQEPEVPPSGQVSLRRVLEAAAFGVTGVPVAIATAGSLWIPAGDRDELSAAVHQALENVVAHARASQVSVFGDEEDGEVVVSIRDNGVGFEYDEDLLRREGKLGVLKSMKGRIEELGGTTRIQTAPGKGTEVEFRVPRERSTS